MKDVVLLDCTLRDGGYINNWNFGLKNINYIIDKLVESKVDLIELGYYTNTRKVTKNESLFNDLEKLDKELKNKNNILMINYGEVNIDNIPNYEKINNIYALRIAFHKKDIVDAIDYCRKIKEKGWTIFVQPMITMLYNDNEITKMIKMVNSIMPEALYIVDSFGTMKENDIKLKFKIVNNLLNKNISLGFHSHNNLQLSYSNVISFINMSKDRKVYIDASVYGMGRGAGNLNTELIISYLNEKKRKYEEKPLLEIIDKCLIQEKQIKNWGYSVDYYLSAINGIHPTYITCFKDEYLLSSVDINNIIKIFSEDKKTEFDKEYAKELCMIYSSEKVDDTEAIKQLKKLVSNKKILLIGPGKSIINNREKIMNELNKKNIFSIAINGNDLYLTDAAFYSNKKRYNESSTKTNYTLLTSNIKTKKMKNELLFDYKNSLSIEYKVSNNGLLMMLSILKKTNVKEIILAGFDGFLIDNKKNFYSEKKVYYLTEEFINKLNEITIINLKKYKKIFKIKSITPTKYIGG